MDSSQALDRHTWFPRASGSRGASRRNLFRMGRRRFDRYECIDTCLAADTTPLRPPFTPRAISITGCRMPRELSICCRESCALCASIGRPKAAATFGDDDDDAAGDAYFDLSNIVDRPRGGASHAAALECTHRVLRAEAATPNPRAALTTPRRLLSDPLPEYDSPREAGDALNTFACRRCVCKWLELPPGEQEFSASSTVTNPSVISTWELQVSIKAAISGDSTYWYIHVESDENASGGDYIPDADFLATPFNTTDPDDEGVGVDGDGDGFGDGTDDSGDGFGDDSGDGFGDDSFSGDGFGDSDDDAKRPPQPPTAARRKKVDSGAAASKADRDAGDADQRAAKSLKLAHAEWRKRGEAAEFDLTTRLVREDCAEANRLPGVRAGYSYTSPSAPVHVWLAIDLSSRYNIDPIRADALVSLICTVVLTFPANPAHDLNRPPRPYTTLTDDERRAVLRPAS